MEMPVEYMLVLGGAAVVLLLLLRKSLRRPPGGFPRHKAGATKHAVRHEEKSPQPEPQPEPEPEPQQILETPLGEGMEGLHAAAFMCIFLGLVIGGFGLIRFAAGAYDEASWVGRPGFGWLPLILLAAGGLLLVPVRRAGEKRIEPPALTNIMRRGANTRKSLRLFLLLMRGGALAAVVMSLWAVAVMEVANVRWLHVAVLLAVLGGLSLLEVATRRRTKREGPGE